MSTAANTSPTASPRRSGDLVSRSLARARLGTRDLVTWVLSSATPLTVIAGVVTTAYATTGLLAIPAAFLVVAVVLALFATGYVAMARYLTNAGAFYAYIAAGIGKVPGVAAAWLALAAYNCLQVGLYGAVGAAASPLLLQWLGITAPWWALALAAWFITSLLGLSRVELNSRLLTVLLLSEIAVILVFSLANLTHPAPGINLDQALTPLNPGQLLAPGVGALLVIAVLGFVGFEAAVVFSEESKDPGRTVPRATYTAIAVTGVLYALASWGMSVATGPGQIVQASRDAGPELLFTLAADRLGQTAADIGHVLFVTSVLAALVSFHGTTARYAFALGRERVLPAALGRTSARTSAPVVASLTQSCVGLAVIVVYAVQGWDPITRLFFVLGTFGGFGVLILLLLTSVAVIGFFASNPRRHTRWTTLTAPFLAACLLIAMLALAIRNMPTLLGVPPGDPLPTVVLAVAALVLVLGAGWGLFLRHSRPEVYAAIGLGDASARPDAPSAAGVWS